MVPLDAMDTGEHIERLEAAARAMALALAGSDPSALGTTVPTCPAWTVRDLAEHTAGLYRWATTMVEDGVTAEVWRLELPIVYPRTDAEVAGWFAEGIDPMLAAFRAAPPHRKVWAWGADPHARFWPRRMLHETVVHGADLELALGREAAIDAAVAVDGIDELLTNLAHTARWGAPIDRLRGEGETLSLLPQDRSERWRIRFEPAGFWWDRGEGGGDATVTGTAADLYLFLQGRQRTTLGHSGRLELIERWRSGLDF